MTRIVAGRYRGRNLQVPRTGTRPTSEMAREAIFSHLESRNYVSQARCWTSSPVLEPWV